MYDYATVTKQNQTIQVIQENTEAIEKLNTTVTQTGIILASFMAIMLLERFVKVCTGGKW